MRDISSVAKIVKIDIIIISSAGTVCMHSLPAGMS